MKLHWKQIALGVLTDLGISLIVGVVPAIVGAIVLVSQGVPEAQIEARMMAWTPYLASNLVLGLLASLIGGYVAAGASSTKDETIKNAVAFGIITVILGTVLQVVLRQTFPMWYQVIAYLLIVPAAFLGGLWRWRNVSKHRVLDVAPAPLPDIPQR